MIAAQSIAAPLSRQASGLESLLLERASKRLPVLRQPWVTGDNR